MKKLVPYFILFVFTFLNTGINSIAQNNMLAGRITDKNNNPVPNAIITLHDAHKQIFKTKTDSDGLYYTKRLSPGNYSVMIMSNDKQRSAGKVSIAAGVNEKLFYNFCLKDKKAITTLTDKDPFMATMLARRDNEDPREMVLFGKPGRMFFVKADTSGKPIRNSLPASAY